VLHKAHIAGLTMDPDSNTPIILLKVDSPEQMIPIWIGLLEATSIASALKDVEFDRPMTHDLFKNFTGLMDVTVTKIEVCDIVENTYYARIHFIGPKGPFDMDARPSDAIAIALRFKAHIYVDDKVLEKSTPVETDVEVVDDSDEGRKWADYLKNLSKDEFGKYKV
jgi:uncharacterized protein